MDSIRNEALRRASQMHKSNTSPADSSGRDSPPETKQQNRNRNNNASSGHTQEGNRGFDTETSRTAHNKEEAPHPKVFPHKDNTLFADKEKLLILLLILILGTEDDRDPTVILALLYLII